MKSVLDDAMSGTDPAEFNQAIMNFGALQCVPKNPDCTVCPLNDGCFAHNSGRVVDLPRKKARKARNTRYFHYLVITSETGVVMRHRTDKDIWQGMYDFPLRELSDLSLLSQQDLHDWVFSHTAEGPFSFESPIQDKQILTHQNIVCVFYPCLVNRPDKTSFSSGVFFVDFRNLHKFAVPKIIDCYFRVKSILL